MRLYIQTYLLIYEIRIQPQTKDPIIEHMITLSRVTCLVYNNDSEHFVVHSDLYNI